MKELYLVFQDLGPDGREVLGAFDDEDEARGYASEIAATKPLCTEYIDVEAVTLHDGAWRATETDPVSVHSIYVRRTR